MKIFVILVREPEDVILAVDPQTGKTATFEDADEAKTWANENCNWHWDVVKLLWEN